jgi:hypothetical protein
LSDVDYPQAAVAAFEQIAAATGLVFPTDRLREAGVKFLEELTKNIADNPELAKLIANLEQNFSNDDSSSRGPRIAAPKLEVPSADEIAAELEDYLFLKRKQSSEDQE